MVSPKGSLRRSVVVPMGVAEEAAKYAPKEIRGNFNRIVVTALEEFADRRREEALVRELADMATDKDILRECRNIQKEFSCSVADGLKEAP